MGVGVWGEEQPSPAPQTPPWPPGGGPILTGLGQPTLGGGAQPGAPSPGRGGLGPGTQPIQVENFKIG